MTIIYNKNNKNLFIKKVDENIKNNNINSINSKIINSKINNTIHNTTNNNILNTKNMTKNNIIDNNFNGLQDILNKINTENRSFTPKEFKDFLTKCDIIYNTTYGINSTVTSVPSSTTQTPSTPVPSSIPPQTKRKYLFERILSTQESAQAPSSMPTMELPKPKNKQIPTKKVKINVEINSLADIIELTEKYPLDPDIEYNINMDAIHSIKEPLIEMNSMIGMESLKTNIVEQILYFIQGLHNTKGDFMHTCIYGSPGTGKTEIAKLMGKIFSGLGILNKKSFKKVTRSDLIAAYLGQTALKTKEVIEKSLGGVLFIDEAYALGNEEKRDSFAKECIDTICEALSDNKDNLMVIIAGYEKDLKNCFFSYNQGLDSRFTWRFKTDDYKPEELREIFIKKIKEAGWTYDDNDIKTDWFKEKYDYFKYFGRDMETLFSKTKIAHSKRVFCLDEEEKKKITIIDLENGFKKFLENDEVKKRVNNGDDIKQIYKNMYL
jgi:SpoVK/Ycf46/Vps4 family AAA+-type ATPase